MPNAPEATIFVPPPIPDKYEVLPLTRGQSAIVDSDDFEQLSKSKWCAEDGRKGRFYAKNSQNEKMHRVIMSAPYGVEVDHINGNTLDNRKSNLRLADRFSNCANQRTQVITETSHKQASRFKGVTWKMHSSKWVAQIKVRQKNRYLGSFLAEEDAARAYDVAAKEAFGEFAKTNF